MKITKEKVIELIGKIKVVEIKSVEKHENADKLWILKIYDGEKEHQIVTAATNMKEGDLVPWLMPGELVPGAFFEDGTEFRLEERKMRGEMSEGMILAEDEIGLSEDHDGIMILNDVKAGGSLLDALSEDEIEKICKNAGVVEISAELQERIDLILSVGNSENGGEVVGEDQLPEILTSNEPLFTYDGFEPSGQMHIAQGIIRAINTNKMIKAGFTFRMWVADWFAFLNNKMGGDLDKIHKVGEYFIEIWRAAGMNLEQTEFLWTSDFIDKKEYWETVMRVSRSSTLKRILRTTEIMGRGEADNLMASQIIYPCMQITDIFKVMQCQVTQLGLDQRKVNMLAREIGPELGFWRPVVVSHGMLQGLGKPVSKNSNPEERSIAMKMSKSIPDSAIFMTDSTEEVKRKIIKAYCPEGEVKDNPILDYCKQIIFEANHLIGFEDILENGFRIEREEKFGGNVSFDSFEDLQRAYEKKEIYPLDLKNAVIKYLNLLIDPVRKHFESDTKAKQLLEEVRSFQITR